MVAQSRKMTMSAISRSLLHLRRDQRGIAAVTLAVTLPLLLAFGALAINSGLWFTIKRENQSAADAAALSAAYELMADPTKDCKSDPNLRADRLTPAAMQAVAANQHVGWDNTVTNTMVACPYTDSLLDTEFPDGYQAVSVTLQQDQSSLFAFTPLASATIATKSVGVVKKFDTACLLALSPTGTGVGLTGTSNITMPQCSVVADSTDSAAISLNGSTNITADTVVTAGNISGISNLTLTSPPPQIFAPPVADPYQPPACNNNTPPLCLTHGFLTSGMPGSNCALPPTPPLGNCKTGGPLSVSVQTNSPSNLSAGTEIDGNLSFSGNGTVNLSPGTYWITDGSLIVNGNITLACPNCSLGGAGVTIIFTGTGRIGTLLRPSGSLTITLNAPGSGIYAGLLMVQDTVAGANYDVGGTIGNAGSPISGLLYFPSTNLAFVGNIQTAGNCLVAVASQFSFTGNIDLNGSACSPAGLSIVPVLNTVVLAE
jgi:Flp pilus assembly protein TadG